MFNRSDGSLRPGAAESSRPLLFQSDFGLPGALLFPSDVPGNVPKRPRRFRYWTKLPKRAFPMRHRIGATTNEEVLRGHRRYVSMHGVLRHTDHLRHIGKYASRLAKGSGSRQNQQYQQSSFHRFFSNPHLENASPVPSCRPLLSFSYAGFRDARATLCTARGSSLDAPCRSLRMPRRGCMFRLE